MFSDAAEEEKKEEASVESVEEEASVESVEEEASVESVQEEEASVESVQEEEDEEQEDSFYSHVESFQKLKERFEANRSLTIRALRGQYEGEICIVTNVYVSPRARGRNSVTCIAQGGGTKTASFYDVNDFEVAH